MKVRRRAVSVNPLVMGVLFSLALSIPMLVAEDWPRWRGPRADGSWQGPKLPEQWPEDGLKRIWSQPIGGGYAGPALLDGRLFITDRETLKKGTEGSSAVGNRKEKSRPADKIPADPDGHERILCHDAHTGKRIWSHRYETAYGDLGGYSNGPRAMATVHDGRVYTLGAVGHLLCLDAVSGKVLWAKDLVRDFKARVPMWGFAASPLIDEDRVIVHVGAEPNGCLLAFNRLTGEEVWRSLGDPAGYCTPILIHTPFGKQLIAWTPENINGVEPHTGKRLWSLPYEVMYGVSIATPIYREGVVFVSGYWEGSRAIRLGPRPTDAELIWEEKARLNGLMAQPLYRDGYVYLLEKSQGLVCFDLKTGKKLWDDHRLTPRGRNPHASIIWLGDSDRVLILNSVGQLILARLSPKGYEEQSRTKVIEGQVWSHPAFAGNRIYLRSDGAERSPAGGPFELACVSLVEEE